MSLLTVPEPLQRAFLPKEFKVTVWSRLKPYYNELLKRPINSLQELEDWVLHLNELGAVVSEEFNWRYIRLSCNSEDERIVESYNYAIQEIAPKIAPIQDELNQKLINSPYAKELDQERYFIYIRSIKNAVALFNKENIPILTELKMKTKEYGRICSQMTVKINGEEMMVQQASRFLEEHDREVRKDVYYKIMNRFTEDKDEINNLFDELLEMRHRIALNAGFSNYRDYKFQSLGRFDYSVEDCFTFHDSIANEIVPIVNVLDQIRKEKLQLDKLRPWDGSVDTYGDKPLRPSKKTKELVNKSIKCLSKVDPYFGECLAVMNEMEFLDLDTRKGKRPGGYNMPLPQTGIPFIFMNATNSIKDMRTIMHESGHAVHSFLTREYRLSTAKRPPSEVAELAAMTMELLTMDHWDIFFENKEDLRRAKIWQLEKLLGILPWIATIDKFQHWIYTNPEHSQEDRKSAWNKINGEFKSSVTDWEGLEELSAYTWQRQLHIFEVPFYYIEYGMAQLGAIAIWKQYRQNPTQAIQNYTNALKLGYTKTIGEIYKTAGIEFDFSRAYVRELVLFVKEELEALVAN